MNDTQQLKNNENKEVGFTWWKIWAWLGLTIGNLYILSVMQNAPTLAIVLLIINNVLNILILRYNKYAFLIATIICLNPILWVINGVYLKNRWRHEKVNGLKTTQS